MKRGEKAGARRDRATAERLGRRAEWLCRIALRLKGYRILAARLRVPAGEIDILAERGGTLAVVEVKARRDLDAALAAVSEASWRRLARAAGQVVAARAHLAGHGVRFDLMAVLPGRWPIHMQDVWRG